MSSLGTLDFRCFARVKLTFNIDNEPVDKNVYLSVWEILFLCKIQLIEITVIICKRNMAWADIANKIGKESAKQISFFTVILYNKQIQFIFLH